MLGLDDATHYSLEQFLQFCVFMEKTPCEILEEIKLDLTEATNYSLHEINKLEKNSLAKHYKHLEIIGHENRCKVLRSRAADQHEELPRIEAELVICISKMRVEQQLSQEEMAALLGISITTYTNFENGKTRLTLKRLILFALCIGKKPEDIFRNVHYDWSRLKFIPCKMHYKDCSRLEATMIRGWARGLDKIDLSIK